jgi:hypothetical protein
VQVPIESVSASLRIADDWHRKGQPTWENNCLRSALMGYLSIALTETGRELGMQWLKEHHVVDVLRRHQITLQEIAREVEGGRLPGSVIGGNYHDLVYAHLAWCLEEYQLGEWYVAFSQRAEVAELSTKFWREYARAMRALVAREQYHPIELKLRGQERYWMAHLNLIQAASANQPLEAAKAELENTFTRRNTDRRIRDDSYQIEGSADHPVRWDFRSHSILKYVARKKCERRS